MPTIFNVKVTGIFANNQSRNAAATLNAPGLQVDPKNPWFFIESTNFDCVINMLIVLANAKSTQGPITVNLDNNNHITDVFNGPN